MGGAGGGYFLRRQGLRVMEGVTLLGGCAPLSRRRHSCTSAAFSGQAFMRRGGARSASGNSQGLGAIHLWCQGVKGSAGFKGGNSTAQCCGTTPGVCFVSFSVALRRSSKWGLLCQC